MPSTTLLDRMLLTLDVIGEEERALHLRFGGGGDGGAGGGPGEAPDLTGLDAEPERFSSDSAWMPRLVLIAKSTHVWLDQLSRRYGTEIRTLDAIPDEELDRLARWGITGLWLIGLWERSPASQRIKVWRGNPDAAASAYSLDDYVIAEDLGGEPAWADLRQRAWQRGVRLASDMVPNHMGIDSRWVTEHPEWFLSLAEPPYPGYTFQGENLAEHDRVEIRIEDHYWDNSDAAVVFERRDRHTGERRYIYHGNDGTSFPWNDTAQLDFSQAAVREQVIQTILAVARRFPVIRFDAAMVLAKKHVRRLWFPGPGEGGGGIPSRAEHGTMTQAEFDAAMPDEFWREVVDRVAAEVPDTLLLAEAFWLLEGYFVRTLGMHRVYNSAFMHMLRDEDNAGYRRVLKETLEFDPEILKRYVNFMNNPDEKTAVEQFGKGDKYIGVATMLATLPGLPMLGHGQFEGFAEKYGMEFRRARSQETVDEWLVARHEREIVPLLHRRGDFAEARDFLLYDVAHDDGGVDEHVFAYSNGSGPSRSLVVYHNRYAETSGWIRESAAYAVKDGDGSRRLVQRSLADGLGLAEGSADHRWIAFREQRTSLEYLRSVADIRERGLHVALRAYETRVFWEIRELYDSTGIWRGLAERLGGRGVASLEGALRELQLAPVHDALRAVIDDPQRPTVERFVAAVADSTGTTGDVAGTVDRVAASARASLPVVETIGDPSQEAALRLWALLAPLGSLAPGAPVGPTSRAWFEELRLGAGGRGRAARPRARRGRRVVGRGARARARGPAARVAGRRTAGRPRIPARRGVAGEPGDPRLPADQRLGRRGVVPPRVVGGARRVGGPARAGRDADRRAGRAPGRAQRRSRRQLLEAGEASGYRIDRLREALVVRRRTRDVGHAAAAACDGLPPGPAARRAHAEAAPRSRRRTRSCRASDLPRRRRSPDVARGLGRRRPRHDRPDPASQRALTRTRSDPACASGRRSPHPSAGRSSGATDPICSPVARPMPIPAAAVTTSCAASHDGRSRTACLDVPAVGFVRGDATERIARVRRVRPADELAGSRRPARREGQGTRGAHERSGRYASPSMIRRRIGNGGAPCEMTASRCARSSKPGVRG